MRFRFVGNESTIGNVRLCTFGQLVDLDAKTAHSAITGRIGLVPDEDFEVLGFTEEELTNYAEPESHFSADAVFMVKRKQAHIMASRYHYQYKEDTAKGDTFMSRAAASAPPAPVKPVPPPAPVHEPEHQMDTDRHLD